MPARCRYCFVFASNDVPPLPSRRSVRLLWPPGSSTPRGAGRGSVRSPRSRPPRVLSRTRAGTTRHRASSPSSGGRTRSRCRPCSWTRRSAARARPRGTGGGLSAARPSDFDSTTRSVCSTRLTCPHRSPTSSLRRSPVRMKHRDTLRAPSSENALHRTVSLGTDRRNRHYHARASIWPRKRSVRLEAPRLARIARWWVAGSGRNRSAGPVHNRVLLQGREIG